MPQLKIVLDTNVLVSGLRSKKGASFQILSMLGTNQFEICLSVALVLEYEEILTRLRDPNLFSEKDVKDFIDYICSIGRKFEIHYLWRPTLNDPDDEMILELAVAAKADFIVTHNIKDFIKANVFEVKVISPIQFLKKVEG